ncbi:unnamed protein product [Schistosoma turkestanicum]|nr:unnamed protein product [Schistosoma turkestanicum]
MFRKGKLFHYSLFVFTFIQCCVINYITDQCDVYLRLRAPLHDIPNYVATRMPWIPGQYKLKNLISAVWWTLCFLYIPLIVIYWKCYVEFIECSKFRCRWIKRTRLNNYETEYFYHLKRFDKSDRQWLLLCCIMCSAILWFFYLYVYSKSLQFVNSRRLRETIHVWLSGLVNVYFFEPNELPRRFAKASPTTIYHHLDDGVNAFLVIDIIQVMFECCGVYSGLSDWILMNEAALTSDLHGFGLIRKNPSGRMIPYSCCKKANCSSGFTFDQFEKLTHWERQAFHENECTEPIFNFVKSKWMKVQTSCLPIIIITMIPQIISMLIYVQKRKLWEHIKAAIHEMVDSLATKRRKGISSANISKMKKDKKIILK